MKNQYRGEDCLKNGGGGGGWGAWAVCRFKGDAWRERGHGVFQRRA